MSDGDDEALSLGERLLMGVRGLWGETNRLSKIADHHGVELEDLKRRMSSLEKQIHGLKVSRGRAVAKSARLQDYLSEAVSKLETFTGSSIRPELTKRPSRCECHSKSVVFCRRLVDGRGRFQTSCAKARWFRNLYFRHYGVYNEKVYRPSRCKRMSLSSSGSSKPS